jgi:hypothetical protein
MTDEALIEKMVGIWDDDVDGETNEGAMALILRFVREHDKPQLKAARREGELKGLRDAAGIAWDMADKFADDDAGEGAENAAMKIEEAIAALSAEGSPMSKAEEDAYRRGLREGELKGLRKGADQMRDAVLRFLRDRAGYINRVNTPFLAEHWGPRKQEVLALESCLRSATVHIRDKISALGGTLCQVAEFGNPDFCDLEQKGNVRCSGRCSLEKPSEPLAAAAQHQGSLSDQLAELAVLANRAGLYDAADVVGRFLANPSEAPTAPPPPAAAPDGEYVYRNNRGDICKCKPSEPPGGGS